ncbi:MAG: ABC transporter ATP-binding protein, partial [Pseudomonadota bacterium]
MTSLPHVLLSASNLSLSANGAVLLNNLNVQINAGEVVGVIGPNGAGKSSLLKLLAGVSSPTTGVIRLEDKALADCTALQKAKSVGYLEQRPHVYWPLSVAQIVSLGRLPHADASAVQNDAAVEVALKFTGIASMRERLFNTLSEGEKMLVNISRVLATEPRMILADEPTAALDPYHQLLVLELLRALATQGRGIMVVLHDLTLAARFCDRLVLLAAGSVVCDGKPEAVLTSSHIAQAYHIDATYDEVTGTVTT